MWPTAWCGSGPRHSRASGLRWDPKGDDRNVPLSAPALAIAQKMLAATKGRWLFAAPPAPGVVDDRLRASRLWAQLKKAKKAANVKQGTLHSFRHFFVSTMANANVSPFKVMKIVGHSSLDIILTYYHVSEDELLGRRGRRGFRRGAGRGERGSPRTKSSQLLVNRRLRAAGD